MTNDNSQSLEFACFIPPTTCGNATCRTGRQCVLGPAPSGDQTSELEWRRVEYGVIVDRTRDGLGYYLAKTTESLPMAEMVVEALGTEYPVEIKTRYVTRSEWQPMVTAEHVPECNDRCSGGAHYLEGADRG